MKLSTLLARLGSGIYTVTRSSPGSYGTDVEDGRFRPGAAGTFLIRASIQPLTGVELLRLPEGERTRERIVVFTAEQLQTTEQSDAVSADLVEYQGNQFEVESVETWTSFYRCVAARVEE